MRKPKRRYEKVEDVDADIDRYRKKYRSLMISVEALESLAHEQIRLANSETLTDRDVAIMLELADGNEKKSRRARVTATNIMERKMKELGEKRSQLLTPTLSAITTDISVES